MCYRRWVSFLVGCGGSVFLSSSLSRLTLSILGLNLKLILSLFYLFWIFDKFEQLICRMC
ncbi:hypothetical protein ACB092_03G021900 [Castanea dentata]